MPSRQLGSRSPIRGTDTESLKPKADESDILINTSNDHIADLKKYLKGKKRDHKFIESQTRKRKMIANAILEQYSSYSESRVDKSEEV